MKLILESWNQFLNEIEPRAAKPSRSRPRGSLSVGPATTPASDSEGEDPFKQKPPEKPKPADPAFKGAILDLANANTFSRFKEVYLNYLLKSMDRRKAALFYRNLEPAWNALIRVFDSGKTDPKEFDQKEAAATFLKISDMGLGSEVVKRKFFKLALATWQQRQKEAGKGKEPSADKEKAARPDWKRLKNLVSNLTSRGGMVGTGISQKAVIRLLALADGPPEEVEETIAVIKKYIDQ